MNHKRVTSGFMKYLNLLLGVLMLVVLSLNLESIFHCRRNELLDYDLGIESNVLQRYLGVLQDEETSQKLVHNCHKCHDEALESVISFNVVGAFLSAIFAVYSFLFAFKLEKFNKYFIIYIPLAIMVSLSAIVNFIYTFMHKKTLPGICRNLGIDKKCDADFAYHMEYKILPYSFLMLVLIPQFLARSMNTLFIKFCISKKEYKYESKYIRRHLYSNHEINNIELLDSKLEFGFRELPIDCPHSIQETSNPLFTINEKNRNAEDYEANDQIVADIINNSQQPITFPNRRTIVKSSSLSTIAEERTQNTTTQIMNKSSHEIANINGRFMVQNLLSDFHDKNTFINEIMHVFEPSSKSGHFTRNVPIRFSSPHHKELNNSQGSHSFSSSCTESTDMTLSPRSFTSPLSQKSHKICNDIILKTILTGNSEHNDKTSLGHILAAKKVRFVKRLKNRIETKTGRKLFTSTKPPNLDFKIKTTFNEQDNSPYNLRRNLNMKSKRSINYSIQKIDSPIMNHYENVDNSHFQYLQNHQSLVRIKTDVQPAYF